MEEIEGKGFIIKDRRAFDEKGELRKEAEQEPQKQEASQRPREGPKREQTPPLPEVNFNSLIMSLSSSALIHLGEIEDPHTGQKKKDIPLAKHAIDTIAMLKEKTKGNLTQEEERFLDSVLADLRWRFVKAAEK